MQPNIAYLVLGALAALTSAMPQAVSQDSAPSNATETALPPQSTATAATGAADGARADLTVKFCVDAGFRGRCDTYAVTKRKETLSRDGTRNGKGVHLCEDGRENLR
ncbi:MAG: hypothetical protein Q9182_003798 [Xanthomendoza sp. 2 TL-2023]